jgi:hypothetical protein
VLKRFRLFIFFFLFSCFKFKLLGADAHESLDHSDLTFKDGWNDIPGMNPKGSLNLK